MLLQILENAHTLFLFTYSDLKTILFPVTIFASIWAPVYSWKHFFQGILWIWLHLLQCNVSNQYKTVAEDSINKPWRPIPSGRIRQDQTFALRWTICIICIGLSSRYGWGVVASSIALTLTTVVYDEIGLSGHWVGKNVCAVSGYLTFEVGATKIMSHLSTLDEIALRGVLFSALIILTTIHAQDFSDVDGDRAIGRITIPIHAPEASRIFTFGAVIFWSISLGCLWGIGYLSQAVLCFLGGYIGWRYYWLRGSAEDKSSYLFYNVWLVLAHALPLHARYDILSW